MSVNPQMHADGMSAEDFILTFASDESTFTLIAGEQVLLASTPNTDVYLWYHEGVLTTVMMDPGSSHDFVTAYLTENNK